LDNGVIKYKSSGRCLWRCPKNGVSYALPNRFPGALNIPMACESVGCVLMLFATVNYRMLKIHLLTSSFFHFFRAMLDGLGANVEVAKYTERLVPSTRFIAVDGIAPAVGGSNNFVAPSASVIGKVSIGDHSRFVLLVLLVLK
jgi:hypothetical protein